MNAIRVETVIEKDGELHLSGIPCHRGDKVEAIVLVVQRADEAKRQEAIARLLEHARTSNFYSTAPYPKREELYDRT